MSSLGTSFINKSANKKVAPKAPPPRKRPGVPASTSVSLSKQSTPVARSQTPQASSHASSPLPREAGAQQPEVPADVSPLLQAQVTGHNRSLTPRLDSLSAPAQKRARDTAAAESQEDVQDHSPRQAPNKRQRLDRSSNPTLTAHGDAADHAIINETVSSTNRDTSTAVNDRLADEGSVGDLRNTPDAEHPRARALDAQENMVASDEIEPTVDQQNSSESGGAAARRTTQTSRKSTAALSKPKQTPQNSKQSARNAAGGDNSQTISSAAQRKRQLTRAGKGSRHTETGQSNDATTIQLDKVREKGHTQKNRRGRKAAQQSETSEENENVDDTTTNDPWDKLASSDSLKVNQRPRSKAALAVSEAKKRSRKVVPKKVTAKKTTTSTQPYETTLNLQSNGSGEGRAEDSNDNEHAVGNSAQPAAPLNLATTSGRKTAKGRPARSKKKLDQSEAQDTGAQAAPGAEDTQVNHAAEGAAPVAPTSDSVRRQVKASTRSRRKKQPNTAPTTTSEVSVTEAGRDNDQPALAADGYEGDPNEDAENTSGQRRPRNRSPSTSEDEDHRIDHKSTAMWDLTRDTRKGKVSRLERAMRKVNWKEVKARQEEEQLRALESPDEDGDQAPQADEVTQRLERADEQAQQAAGGALDDGAPGMKVVNGQLVFDTSADTRVNDPQAAAEAEAAAVEGADNADAYEESELANRVTTQTWAKAHKRDKRERISGRGGRWNEVSTDKFYEAISVFGADFTIIQKMFPDKTRRQVKLKFVREEKGNPARIKGVMVGPTADKIPMSLAKYAEMTGKSEDLFKDPVRLNKELETERVEQQKQLELEREELEENVKKKRERARERQKEKEKARREKTHQDKAPPAAGQDGDGGPAGSPAADGTAEDEMEAGQEEFDDEYGIYDGGDEVTQSIET